MKKEIFSLPDSGKRRQFETGSKRDVSEGKGRMDLVPLNVVAMIYKKSQETFVPTYHTVGEVTVSVLNLIDNYIYNGNVDSIIEAIIRFGSLRYETLETMVLEVSRHFEAGAHKYDDRNWEKGQPLHVYIDSGVRHLIRYLRGDVDEPHDGAFLWNMFCLVWTHYNLEDMNDLPFNPEVKDGKRD